MIAGLGERSGLRYQLDVRLAAQQNLHEISEAGMILNKHDTYLLCPCFRIHSKIPCGKGTRNRTLVPCSTSLSISSSPPMREARSRMLFRPTPGELSDPTPRPVVSDLDEKFAPIHLDAHRNPHRLRVPTGVGERLLDYARDLRSGLSQRRRGNLFSHLQAYLESPGHRPAPPHQRCDYFEEGPIFFIFEAQVVDHLAEALSTASTAACSSSLNFTSLAWSTIIPIAAVV